jgi:hypothetical protein
MTIIRFPANDFGSGGGDGPEGPMLEQRVTKIEGDIAPIKSDIAAMKVGQRSIEDSLLESKPNSNYSQRQVRSVKSKADSP